MKKRPVWHNLRSLRAQLLLWAILPLSLALIAVAFTGVYSHEQSMQRLVEERDRIVAEVYAQRVAEILDSHGSAPPLTVWADLFHDRRVGENGVIYLIDPLGQAAYHPDRTLCGTDLRDHSAIPEALSGQVGSTPCRGPDGRRMLLAYAAAGDTGWRVIVEEPWEDLVDPILRFSGIVPFVAAVAGLVAGLALLFGAQTVVVPLQRLSRAAGQVPWGDVSAIAEPVGGVKEIEDLQQALQDMADRIQGYQESMRDYLAAITEAQESERTRLARELHDETVQDLVAMGQRLEMAQRALQRGDAERTRTLLEELRDLCSGMMEEVRRLSRDLRPAYLEDLGFVPALDMLAQESSRQGGLRVDLLIEGEVYRIAPTRELALYRIAQQALNNALQHAGAERVELSLHFAEDGITLQVSDDGAGFDVPERPDVLTQSGHFGLLGMKERALLAGGELQVSSVRGRGTTIRVQLPR